MNSIKTSFLYNAAFQLLKYIVPLITTPYLTRVLGPEGLGTSSYSYSVAHMFCIFVLLGVENYGCREIAKHRDNKAELSATFWSVWFLQLFCGLIVNVAYILYCLLVKENKIIAIIHAGYTLSACFEVNWFHFGLERFKQTSIRSMAVKVLTTVLTFCLIKDAGDLSKYCLIVVCSHFLGQIVLWPDIIRNIPFVIPKFNSIIVRLKPNLMLFTTTIAVTVYKVMDKIMLGAFSQAEQVGFYEASERIIQVPIALINALGTIMLPRVTNMLASKRNNEDRMLYNSMMFAMFITSSMCFGIMGISKEFVPLFYGEGYDICVNLYLILLPSCLFLSFANVIRTQYLLPHHMDRAYITSAILGAVVNVAINSVLIVPLGAVGVSIGTLIAEAVVCIYQAVNVGKKISLKPLIRDSIPFVLSGIIMFFVVYFVDMSAYSVIVAMIFKVLIGIVVYFAALLCISRLFRINYLRMIK